MAIKMDMSKLKHVKSDEHSTTLQHPEGHLITLAHKALNPDTQAQLKALAAIPKANQTQSQAAEQDLTKMADGGKIEYDQYGYPKTTPTPAPVTNEFRQTGSGVQDTSGYNDYKKSAPVKECSGGSVQRYASGTGDVTQPNTTGTPDIPPVQDTSIPQEAAAVTDQLNPGIQAKRDLYNKIAGKPDADGIYMHPDKIFGSKGEQPSNFDPDSWAATEEQMKYKQALQQSDAKDKAADESKMAQAKTAAGIAPPASDMVASNVPPSAQGPTTSPDQMPSPVATPPAPGNTMPGPMDLLTQAYNNELAGTAQQAQAEGALGKAQAGIQQTAIDAGQKAQSTYQTNLKNLTTELDAHMADVKNNLINPDKYWTGDPATGAGGHSKIMSGIGMILGGFGPPGSQNSAVNFIKYNMDKNIEAQSKNLDARYNLVRANLDQFHNLKDATDMARLQQADVVNHYLDQSIATAKTPMAQAAALKAKGEIQKTYAPLAMQMSLRQSMMQLGSSGIPEDEAAYQRLHQVAMMTPGMEPIAKDMAERHVPGYGTASVPVPEAVKTQLTQHKQLDTAVRDLYNFAQTHTTLLPGTADYNTGQQKALALQSAVREGQLGTVYKAGEQPLLDKFINSNPAGLTKTFSTMPKLEELLGSNNRRMNDLLTTYGLHPKSSAPMQQSAPQYKTVNGIKYMRGPNGEAIKVK
jgi:hypothetical protein